MALAQPRLNGILEEIRPALVADASPANAARLLERYVLALAELMLAPRFTTAAFGFLLREQFQPGAAFELLYRELLAPAHTLCGELLAALLGGEAEEEAGILREHAFMGQITAFVHGRATLRQRLHGAEPERVAVEEALRSLLCTFTAGALSPGTTALRPVSGLELHRRNVVPESGVVFVEHGADGRPDPGAPI